ncbi:hypothetical protein [Desulfoscipio geothermicus]|uniref:Uncharacterized protein n=1 Tax=Desulfoscipio geothermicus DSM 3669 TaxID=1121426 RepID=A0A1I6DG89_9FIRM|nr:hypothetical protein [Desulfoscipio geothermicus]SFR04465.1 hypothetical protein SAMN05660706_11074 [Desulfoscipio geothermicus DSM 3669]
MFWMSWIKQQVDNIWAVMPRHGVVPGRKKLLGWLVGKNGCLQAATGGPVAETILPICPATAVPAREPSFAGGVRPGGAARLTGVLHYFTRGPDGSCRFCII